MTIGLEDDISDRLDGLAAATERSQLFIAAEAVRVYVETHEWQVAEIRPALKKADAGEFASVAGADALARKWK